MASIDAVENKDGSTTFYVRYRDLSKKAHAPTARTRAAAEALQRKIERELANQRAELKRSGITMEQLARRRQTFEECGAQWLAEIPNGGTRQAHEIRLRRHVYPTLGSRVAEEILPSHVNATIRTWADLAANTQVQIYVSLRAVMNWAEGEKILDDNPCRAKTIRKPAADDRKTPDAWPSEWVAGVCGAIRKDIGIFPWLGAYCGLRQGEIFGLSPADIVINAQGRRAIRVSRQVKIMGSQRYFSPPKHRKEGDDKREVPLPESIWEILQEYAADRPPMEVTLPWDPGTGGKIEPRTHELYLYTREGGAWDRNYFNPCIWKPALILLGIPPVRLNGTHALRHWFACQLLATGAGLGRVQEYLGHHDEAFTLRTYRRFDVSRSGEPVEAMELLAREMLRK